MKSGLGEMILSLIYVYIDLLVIGLQGIIND